MRKYLFIVLVVLMACEQPTDSVRTEVSAMEEKIQEPIQAEPEPEITEEADPKIMDVPEEIIIMERIVKMNPIPGALGYLFKDGNLRGISADTGRTGFIQIQATAEIDGEVQPVRLTEFFKENGELYFSFNDVYMNEGETEPTTDVYLYAQVNGEVTEADFLPPKPPAPEKLEKAFDKFLFSVYTWDGQEYNKLSIPSEKEIEVDGKKVMKDTTTIISTAKGFDSACRTDQGLLFSQAEPLSRVAGLWYMGNEQRGGPTRIGDYQRIWK